MLMVAVAVQGRWLKAGCGMCRGGCEEVGTQVRCAAVLDRLVPGHLSMNAWCGNPSLCGALLVRIVRGPKVLRALRRAGKKAGAPLLMLSPPFHEQSHNFPRACIPRCPKHP